MNAGTKTPEEIAKETEDWNKVSREVFNFTDTPDVSNRIDLYGINNVFDVIVLYSGVLRADANDQLQGKDITFTGMRKGAIESCRDPTFWYTILSEGKLYDRTKHDFTLSVNDKYPGAVELFPSKS